MEDNTFETYINKVDQVCSTCLMNYPMTNFETIIFKNESGSNDYITKEYCKTCATKIEKPARRQPYKETHKDQIKIYNREYYTNNKAYWTKRHTCDLCGHEYDTAHKWRHNNSKKHKLLVENKK